MFEFSSPLFWYRLIFLAELILAEGLFSFKLPRRTRFPLRLALSVAAIYAITFLFPIAAYNAFYVSFMFLFMFGMTIAGLFVCFDAPLLNIAFCAVAAYAVQHIAYEAYTFDVFRVRNEDKARDGSSYRKRGTSHHKRGHTARGGGIRGVRRIHSTFAVR